MRICNGPMREGGDLMEMKFVAELASVSSSEYQYVINHPPTPVIGFRAEPIGVIGWRKASP